MTTSIRLEVEPSALGPHLAELGRKINLALNSYLPAIDPDGKAGCPPGLAQAMRYSVEAGGKRLRPTLALLAADACGAQAETAMPVACALEMIHTYSLIHDDLPCMDDDDLRRGRPTCHKAFDEATALLAGDALLTLAFETIARDVKPEVAGECVRILAQAAGACGMVGGQMSDLEAEGRSDASLEALEGIHRRKTGALLRASLQLGAAVAAADEPDRRALDRYGKAVGLGFQIVDDLLDVEGDETKLGKRVNKDDKLGKWTYPALMGIAPARARAHELAVEAVEALAPLGERSHWLAELAWRLLERDR